jgi:uridine kinase
LRLLCCTLPTQVLLSKGVAEGKILFLSLIAAPQGITRICTEFPRVKVITSEIDECVDADFRVVPGENKLTKVVM